MKCPRCGSETATRNGNGRGWCRDGHHSFQLSDALTAEVILEANLTKQGIGIEAHGTAPLPAGLRLRGVSSLVDTRTGEKVMEWVKSAEDRAMQQAVLEAAYAAFAQTLPRETARPLTPGWHDADLLNLYVITDYHLGMLAWGEETGADWDIKIAEDLLIAAFERMVAASPRAARAVFAQLGDFLHWDGMEAVTPAHHNLLDADTRFAKLVRVAIRVLRRIIGLLLEKYPEVVVLCAEGNHDPASSVHLREWLAAFYEDEPRVKVITRPDPFYCVEHGETSLFFHHGHKRKTSEIAHVFAAKFREIFGRTKYSYAHMGHLHSIDVRESPLMVVEQHRTLAAPDAYASRGGWLSGREAQVISYHRLYGEWERKRISAAALADGVKFGQGKGD